MEFGELPRPFSSPQWDFEIKYDGHRVLAEIDAGRCACRPATAPMRRPGSRRS
jgi:hypothetical protein